MTEEGQAITAEANSSPADSRLRIKRPPAQERRCQRGAGTEKQCRAARMKGTEFCFFHDPGIRMHRLELRELDELPLGRSQDLHRLLTRVVKAVEKNKLNPQQAYAIGWLVQLLLQTLKGVEEERSHHESQSYGQLVKEVILRMLQEGIEKVEEEFGPDEAEESEWIIVEE